ncbi:unnamed protein product [Prorocentrum cordatum]|uniref:Saccharopine dehydrogenase NADP binding domain-containing protein n=1 Tax=Prorocentrum cordatum TaxID=2364126 RepID=A0ABN9QV82_9DINO|nr:unnamed protein product [Polarella glacialis]
MARKYDAVIFGASGFTGVQVCRQAQRLRPFASWAAAGRSAGRLREAVAQLDASAAKPDIIVADVESHDSLVAMAQQARLVVNVTGPFRFLGEGVVRACIEAGTDYVDICGEPEFMERTLLRYQEAAVAAGVIVCHACAFDSIPADLGVIHSALLYRRPPNGHQGPQGVHGSGRRRRYPCRFPCLVVAFHASWEALVATARLASRFCGTSPWRDPGSSGIGIFLSPQGRPDRLRGGRFRSVSPLLAAVVSLPGRCAFRGCWSAVVLSPWTALGPDGFSLPALPLLSGPLASLWGLSGRSDLSLDFCERFEVRGSAPFVFFPPPPPPRPPPPPPPSCCS